MHLLMLDVDGTLLHSNDYDADCFVRAVTATLNIPVIDKDWGSYEHVTDSGILYEIVFREYGRGPTNEEVRMVQAEFLSQLDTVLDGEDCPSAPVAGAIEFLAAIDSSPVIAASIATGGWEASCRRKLAKSGFSADHIPLASSDDAMSRVGIMECSLCYAKKTYEQQDFRSVTYIGDGSWDMKASKQLEWNFIGVGTPLLSFVDPRPQHWIDDFTNREEIDQILNSLGITIGCIGLSSPRTP